MQHAARPRLLVVEDDRELSSAISDALDEAGFDVMQAEDGRNALDKLGQGADPDVILLDLMMPRMDGWQFRLAQKQDQRFVSIPVVVMTANRSAQARAVDAEIHLQKPFHIENLIGAVERAIAVRDRRRAATHRAHADRLASVWTLASGIAHEINNPLTGLLGHLEMAERLIAANDVQASPRLATCISNAKQGALQIAKVVKDTATLTSGRDSAVEPLPVDPSTLLDSALRMISTELARRARVEHSYEPVPPVRIASGRLLQVFLNLLMNAAQSIPEEGEGVIRLRCFTSDHGEAVIEFRDTGCGIPSDQQTIIFDPFFTTKAPGQGTGLGLSICHEIVSSVGGRIAVVSEVGLGSTFRVILPAAVTEESSVIVRGEIEQRRSGSELRILMVEDDSVVADTIRMFMSPHDVVVEPEIGPARARLLAGEHYDVVLCDLNLPDGSGAELYVALTHYRPELVDRFILMTGGARRRADADFVKNLGSRALQKPFENDALEIAIRDVAKTVIENAKLSAEQPDPPDSEQS